MDGLINVPYGAQFQSLPEVFGPLGHHKRNEKLPKIDKTDFFHDLVAAVG